MTASYASLRRRDLLTGSTEGRQQARGNRQQSGHKDGNLTGPRLNRMITSYKDLIVWQRGMDLVEMVYQITAKLPTSEQWGLVSQMRRSAISVPSNIAEGYGRQATGEYRHHLSIGRASLLELETQILISQRLGYLTHDESKPILTEIDDISKMLASLVSKLS
jgi:four helix bundle protein